MTDTPAPANFYVTGGTMAPDAESYVVRGADDELLQLVQSRDFGYVLTTRQMGKSSLMARTASKLAAKGVGSVQISIETVRESGTAPSPDQFFYGIAHGIHRELRLPGSLSAWWCERELLPATQRFYEFLTTAVLEGCPDPVVVFIDEIDSTIGLPFADDFFATIRACYNARASRPDLRRLTFVLLGVATPAQLVSNPARTPFNIGRGIELGDFTADDAAPLARGFAVSEPVRRALLDRILHWTGGHPYLTQTVCRAVSARTATRSATTALGKVDQTGAERLVDEEVEKLFMTAEAAREERNLKFVRSRLTQGYGDLRAVLSAYQRVLSGTVVKDQPESSVHASLKLAGVVRTDADGNLRVRNRIYEHVFGRDWVRRETPRNRTRIAMVASAAALLLAAAGGLYSYQQTRQAQAQLDDLRVRSEEQYRARAETLQQLVRLAEDKPFVWDPEGRVVPEQFVRQIGPGVIAEAPWLFQGLDPSRLLDVIERSHRLLVPSRDTFGAMSFALEEVWLREPLLRERARALHTMVREAFIRYHTERTQGFERPPAGAAADPLNPMVGLPEGRFEMGDADIGDRERPVHLVQLSAFSIQQHEVTNDEYRRFDPDHEFPSEQGRHPVANVSWYEASAYAAWLGGALPSEAQWEYAARGTGATSGRIYPWGNETPDEGRAVFGGRRSTEPAGSRPAGRTEEGLDDMVGNVSEWCRDWFREYQEAPSLDPYGPTSRADAPVLLSRVFRGGSFKYFRGNYNLRPAYRHWDIPDVRDSDIGFRVVSSRLRL